MWRVIPWAQSAGPPNLVHDEVEVASHPLDVVPKRFITALRSGCECTSMLSHILLAREVKPENVLLSM